MTNVLKCIQTGLRGSSLLQRCQPCMTVARTFTSDSEISESDDSPSNAHVVMTGERGMNKVNLIGRVGMDPEVRGTEPNTVTLFSLATSRSYKKDNDIEYTQFTDWHRIATFKGIGKYVASSVRKGDKLFISGAIRYSSYTTDSGEKKHSSSIVADDIITLVKGRHQNESDE